MNVIRHAWRTTEARLAQRGYSLRWFPPSALARTAQLTDYFLFVASHLTLVKRDVFFVQIGANDGVKGDPIFPFVRRHGWSGIALEPLPSVFTILQHNYQPYPRVSCVNAALGTVDGSATFYSVDAPADADRDIPRHQLSSFKRDVILSHKHAIPDIETLVREERVRTTTWASLTAGLTRTIDVVVIDTEGFDAEVVRMIDFTTHRPSIVHFEHVHLGKADVEACTAQLIRLGYKVAINETDVTAYSGLVLD